MHLATLEHVPNICITKKERQLDIMSMLMGNMVVPRVLLSTTIPKLIRPQALALICR